ncbi:RecT family recombinase [Streptomyces sp. DH12]|uniref:recombinase RecT n=1 Tax=Streptomyces sp. DH12 TaxID=2857010 RepID=UPI001E31FBDC|nr:RecT family recombinase [Streptomyces sp. DH12]
MSPTTLKERVRAAAAGASAPARRAAAVAHDRTAEEPAEHEHQQDAVDASVEWLRRYEQHFADALPQHLAPPAFFAAVRDVLPHLRGCTPASVLQALLTCARFGLVPDGQHAAVVADEGRAVMIPMYQGLVDLMHRSGLVESVRVGMIHAGDDWRYVPSAPAPDDFMHEPRVESPKSQRGEPILAYAFCWLRGGVRSQVIVLSREDAEEIRDEYSRAYQRARDAGETSSFWHTDFDAMWLKSAIRRLAKLVPTSAELRALAAADDAGDAGQVQVLHAPDPQAAREAAGLRADGARAHAAAEGPQEPSTRQLPVKRRSGRSKPKKNRGGRRARVGQGRAAA